MKLNKYISQLKYPLLPRTVTFLIAYKRVILGLKKKGFGKGYWLGIGGKIEKRETIEKAAKREVREEINVNILKLNKVGTLNFYFPYIKDESWNQQVHVFLSNRWKGIPKETAEIKPQWFDTNQVPYDEMWDDAHYWLPKILEGQIIEGNFMFDRSNSKVEEVSIKFL